MAAQVSNGESSKASTRAAVFQRLHPRAYLERFVAEGFRADGRELRSWWPTFEKLLSFDMIEPKLTSG